MEKCNVKGCGGCDFLHLSYEETVKNKFNYVSKLFNDKKFNIKIEKIIPAKQHYQYRNKMIVAFQTQNGKTVHGFFQENSHRVIPMDKCLMHSDIQNNIASYIKDLLIKLRIRPYDEDRRTGLIRYALIKHGFKSGEVMVVIVTASEVFPGRNDFVKMLRAKFPEITTVIQNINSRKTSIVLGDKERVLFGKGYITEFLEEFKFKISSKSFFQINPEQTVNLYNTVLEFANLNGKEIVLDAYSGVGTIGMFLSKKAKHILSVESNRQAVNAAIANARDNNIKNISFICDDATNYIINLAEDKEKLDVLVLDPPRSGSTPEFLKASLALKPEKIIYVSCEPTTLVRDLGLLTKQYKINRVILVDMFCWVDHVETVVLLTKI
jgi:23S rRNA (uracil1939-C5)-methyltransferase